MTNRDLIDTAISIMRMALDMQSGTLVAIHRTLAGQVLEAVLSARPNAIDCETCRGAGTVDERLGGEHFSNPKAECPDCGGLGEITRPAAVEGAQGASGGDAILPASKPMRDERDIKQALADLQREYNMRAEPFIAALVRIESIKPPAHIILGQLNPPPATGSGGDSERLDYMVRSDAFFMRKLADSGAITYQLVTQDEDENYVNLSGGEHRFFGTPREAIDAAMQAHPAPASGS
jgi:hypothetical protein